MPSIRIGFSTDFNLTNEQVGIGTTFPTARLDVRGQILSDNLLGSGGVSSITRYDGFLSEKQVLAGNITVSQTGKGNLNSLSGEIVIENEVTVTEGTQLTGGRLDSLTVTGKFDLPNGGTLSRSATPEKGSTRFNSDLGQLEFYTGTEWRTTASYDGSGRGRGVFGGGVPDTSFIDYINISSTGNAQYFGELTVSRRAAGSCASTVRGLFGSSLTVNTIDYITIASSGNAIDFGDVTTTRFYAGSCSSSTRGVWGGGYTPTGSVFHNVIDYVQIATIGNALDFGDLTVARGNLSSFSSPTRGVFGGGGLPANLRSNTIDYITISSLGNAVDFGDLSISRGGLGGCSNSTKGIFAAGYQVDATLITNNIDYIIISSLGSAVYFGDLTSARARPGSCSSSTRGIFSAGYTAPSQGNTTNIIDYVLISSSGNALDFGDLTRNIFEHLGCSDSHGGLGGF